MADVITKSLGPSQSKGTVGSLITAAASASGQIYDGLTPSPARSAAKSAPYELRVSDRTTDALPGSTWTFKTSISAETIVDTFLCIDVNAATIGSTTAQRVGLNVIDFITVRSCGVVQEIPYRNVLRFILANCNDEERAALLSAVGGAQTATAETVIAPLPLFWCPYGQGAPRRNHPGLPCHLLSAPVEVEIRMSPVANLLAPGNTFDAAAFSSVKLVNVIRQADACALADARASPSWACWGYEFQEIPAVSVAAGATVTLDCDRFKGNSAALGIFGVTAANITGANFYENADAIGNVEVNIDSARFLRIDSTVSPSDTRKVVRYLSHHWGLNQGTSAADPTFSHRAALIPFGGGVVPGKDGESSEGTGVYYSGSLNLRAVQSVKVDLKNDSADAVTYHTVNIAYARFSVEAGLIKRDF